MDAPVIRTPLAELVTQCGLGAAPPHDAGKLAVFGTQVEGQRGFPQGDWDAADLEEAVDAMRACLDDLEVPSAFVAEAQAELARATAQWLEELELDEVRWLQITAVMAMANARLRDDGYAFAEYEPTVPGWSPDEPVWLLVNQSERRLLASLGWQEVSDT